MLFGSGINAAGQRQNKFEIKHSHLITNVEVNNINYPAAPASPNCKENCFNR